MSRKLTPPHLFNLSLALVVFGFFVANQFAVFGGERLDLTGEAGRILLTNFLALGILGQLGKFAVGHRHWFEALMTLVLLAAHVVAEITIWTRTQIIGIPIPRTLPQWIVGLYWLVGVVDLLALYGPRELRLFATGESEEVRLAKALQTAREELRLALQAQQFAERETVRLEKQLDKRPAYGSGTVQSQYELQCDQCGQALTATSQRGLTNALNAHRRWCEAGGHNGREAEREASEDSQP